MRNVDEFKAIADKLSEGIGKEVFFFNTVQMGGLLASDAFKTKDGGVGFSLWVGDDDGKEIVLSLEGNVKGMEVLRVGDHVSFEGTLDRHGMVISVREWGASMLQRESEDVA